LAPAVVVTAGAAGVAANTPETSSTIRAHAVPRSETHAAGDVFVGALGARLAHGDELAAALAYANAAAALHVSTREAERELVGPRDVYGLLSVERPDAQAGVATGRRPG
jgi:sugar/nucleoside kinase (ribokinase family)